MEFDPYRVEPELVEAVKALQAHILRGIAPASPLTGVKASPIYDLRSRDMLA